MKKLILALAVVLMVSGVVWAQSMKPNPLGSTTGTFSSNFKFDPFPTISAYKPQSVEQRYSGSQFSADVDNYINAMNFVPNIGTFMFLGGHKASGFDPSDFNGISLGYGKTLGNGSYVGIYYGGKLVEEGKGKTFPDGDKLEKVNTESDLTWSNNLALLYAIGGMSFRLDFIADGVNNPLHGAARILAI